MTGTGRVLVCLVLSMAARNAVAQERLEVKYVRDSEEYWTLAQQVYRSAREALERNRTAIVRGAPWGVVLDVDETTLDNSIYQLDRAGYRVPFDSGSWNAWVRREDAPRVPGVLEFITSVRGAGGKVAYISNRDEVVREATRRNLAALGLWQEGDRLCLQTDDRTYTKAVRRSELRKGAGRCAWEGQAITVVTYVGDQMGDFPSPGEEAASGTGAFGVRFFLLPQPMYGNWTSRVTRPAPH